MASAAVVIDDLAYSTGKLVVDDIPIYFVLFLSEK